MLEIFVKKSLNIPKRKSEAENCTKTDNPMAKKKGQKNRQWFTKHNIEN